MRNLAETVKGYNPAVPGASTKDGWTAPPLSELIVRSGRGAADAAETPELGRVVADLLAVRGPSGRFLVPAESPGTAARSLLAYNRLRPLKVRTARAAIGWALRFGAGPLLSEPRRITAGPGSPVLLDHLATVLDESRLVFAATEQGGSGFLTPVLQLFAPDGRSAGFAKIGWDPVTAAMIRTEADALERAARAGSSQFRVPPVRWAGEWEGLELLVTAPMPLRARRLRESELPPVEPLLDVATIDGPLERRRVTESQYWADAVACGAVEAERGRHVLGDLLATIATSHGDVELAFGRWHGDWVEWNLAEADGQLWAWDWAYSAPGVPLGFDLLQFFHLRHRILRGEAPPQALEHAAADAKPGLTHLGIPIDEQRAVTALHHAEVLMREERAHQARATVGA